MLTPPRKIYKPEVDLKPYLYGFGGKWGEQQLLPNLEKLTGHEEILKKLAFAEQVRGYSDFAFQSPVLSDRNYPIYCNLYLLPAAGMGGWDGRGIILVPFALDVYSFALCLHKKSEEGHSPNPSRGWHPGHCELCNVDMTIDSGD